jgi:predicted Fe-Mo cluster-binding NifX family protein
MKDLSKNGIEVIITEELNVEKAIQKYLAGNLINREELIH